MLRQDGPQRVARRRVVRVEGEHVLERLGARVTGERVHVARDAAELARAVGVGEHARVREVPQLPKGAHEAVDGVAVRGRRELPQQQHLGPEVRVLDDVGPEHVAALAVEVVAQEGPARPVREHDDAEARVRDDVAGPPRRAGPPRHYSPAVAHRELAVLQQRL